jgi:hypothetical protein
MRTIGLFSIAITMVVVGIAAWSASTHSAVKAELPQIDPLVGGECKEFAEPGGAQFEIVATGRGCPLVICPPKTRDPLRRRASLQPRQLLAKFDNTYPQSGIDCRSA